MIRLLMNENCFMHTLLVCDVPGKFIPLTTQNYGEILNTVTGINFSEDEIEYRCELIETLIRRCNLRDGLSAADDSLPKRTLEEAHDSGTPVHGQLHAETLSQSQPP